jgi:hypothetical protein
MRGDFANAPRLAAAGRLHDVNRAMRMSHHGQVALAPTTDSALTAASRRRILNTAGPMLPRRRLPGQVDACRDRDELRSLPSGRHSAVVLLPAHARRSFGSAPRAG